MNLPSNGRLAGIDFGTVRVGISICDPGQILASPLQTYNRSDSQQDEKFFQALVEEESIVGFVVGLPVHGSGDESEKSRQAREFGAWLQGVTEVPVAYFDERYSTVQAKQALGAAKLSAQKRKERLDKLAAQIILAAYLESPSKGEPESLS